jgi:hypothetical protein
VRGWLRRPKVVEPKYPARRGRSKLDGCAELLATAVHRRGLDTPLQWLGENHR